MNQFKPLELRKSATKFITKVRIFYIKYIYTSLLAHNVLRFGLYNWDTVCSLWGKNSIFISWASSWGSLPLLFPVFRRSHFRRHVPYVRKDARDPSSERWNCGREIVR